MAWYNGTFQCGHEGRVNVVGPTKNRPWKIERAFSFDCPSCTEEKRAKEIEQENKIALQKAKEWELPELLGTEKQILWANTIRVKLIKQMENYTFEEYCKDRYVLPDQFHNCRIQFKEIQYFANQELIKKIEASYWIDNRNLSTCDLFLFYVFVYRQLTNTTIIKKESLQ